MKAILISTLMVSFAMLSACSTTPNNPGVGGSDQGASFSGQDSDGSTSNENGEAQTDGVSVLSAKGRFGPNGEPLDGASQGEDLALTDIEGEDRFEPVVYFDYDEFILSEKNTNIVRFYALQMLDDNALTVILKGHTDERGSPEYNIALGEKRAKAVEQAMMLFGVESSRIEVISFGEEQPAVVESSEIAWQQNRRVEIVIR